ATTSANNPSAERREKVRIVLALHDNIDQPARHVNHPPDVFSVEKSEHPRIGEGAGLDILLRDLGRHGDLAAHLAVHLNDDQKLFFFQGRFRVARPRRNPSQSSLATCGTKGASKATIVSAPSRITFKPAVEMESCCAAALSWFKSSMIAEIAVLK